MTSAGSIDGRPTRILFVDDEAAVLEALATQMRRKFEVVTFLSATAALNRLHQDRDFAILVSDLRMPEMDGAAFLSWARQVVPDAVRILLTGETDLDAAVNAVNEGQIFRYLRKPCSPITLLKCLDGAAEQHRLLTAERRLLEETFNGCIRALTDVLAVTAPAAFGRATRIRGSANAVAKQLGLDEVWKVDVAAMLSQLGCIAIPNDTMERVQSGHALSPREQAMIARIPVVTEGILGAIPRLEDVCAIITRASASMKGFSTSLLDPRHRAIAAAAQVVRIAQEFDALEARGVAPQSALNALRAREEFDLRVLTALEAVKCKRAVREEVRELSIRDLRAGMVLAEELRMASGMLLAAEGYEVSTGFVERVRNFGPGTIKERVLVRVAYDLGGVEIATHGSASNS